MYIDLSLFTFQGLLARGDLRGGLVEKDEHPGALPGIRVEEHHTSAANHLAPINKSHHHGGHMTNGLDHMTQYRHDVGARPASATELVMTNQNAPSRSHGVAVMTQARMPHPVAGGDHKSHSHSDMSHPHSSIASHSSTNSHPSYSPSSQGHSSHSHSSLSPHMTTMSGPGSNTPPTPQPLAIQPRLRIGREKQHGHLPRALHPEPRIPLPAEVKGQSRRQYGSRNDHFS